jgi:hypothetical protein
MKKYTITSKPGMPPFSTATTHAAATADSREARRLGLDGEIIEKTAQKSYQQIAGDGTTDRALGGDTAPASPAHTNPLKYEPLFSRLTWGNGTCAEFVGDKDTADELGAEMVARWNSQEPDIHTRKAWAAIERQNAEIKALRDALSHASAKLECMHDAMTKCRKDGLPDCQERSFVDTWLKDAPVIIEISRAALKGATK